MGLIGSIRYAGLRGLFCLAADQQQSYLYLMECDGVCETPHGSKNFRLTSYIDFCYKRQTENAHRGEISPSC